MKSFILKEILITVILSSTVMLSACDSAVNSVVDNASEASAEARATEAKYRAIADEKRAIADEATYNNAANANELELAAIEAEARATEAAEYRAIADEAAFEAGFIKGALNN